MVNPSQLIPSKRMDVKENHYDLLEERPENVPRYARFVRELIHHGIFKDRGEMPPVKVFKEDNLYLIARGHSLALAFRVLNVPFRIKIMTPYDLMRQQDQGRSDELARAKSRLMKMYDAVKVYRKENVALGLNSIDDLLKCEHLEDFFLKAESSRNETRARIQEYDTKRIALRRNSDSEIPQPSFSDLEVSGLEAEPAWAIQEAKKVIFNYLKRHNGHV